MKTKTIVFRAVSLLLVSVLLFSLVAPLPAAAVSSPKKAIYILPGFMESRLFSQKLGGIEIWVAAVGLLSELATDKLGMRAELVNNPQGTGMTAYANRNIDKTGLLMMFAPMIASLRTCLALNGLSQEYAVEFFSYNWLQDLNVTAQELAADINAKGYEKVILIAHSNGGLLASTYVAQSAVNKDKVEKCICLATPFTGTHITYEAMETGGVNLLAGSILTALLDIGYDIFVRPISKKWVKNWSSNAPNMYQLSPSREYIEEIPVLYRTPTGTRAISDVDEYISILNKSPAINNNLTDGNARSLKHFRENVLGDDIFSVWEGKDLTMLGCTYGFLTATNTVYRQYGDRSIYEGTIYSKRGDWVVTGISMSGDGRFPFINLPGAHHLTVFADPRALFVINQIILDQPVSQYTRFESSMPQTSSHLPEVGMSDMIRVEIRSSDPLVATLLNSGLSVYVYDSNRTVVARATGEAQQGFMENNFVYNSWESDEYGTNINCYIPKSGYTIEVRTGRNIRSSSDISVRIETLDRSGAFLSEDEYQITGANALSGVICTINGDSLPPAVASGAQITQLSAQTYRQDWQFVADTLSLKPGETVVPSVTGRDAAYMFHSNYIWTTSDPEIATVSVDGAITAVAKGTAIITAAAKDASAKTESISVIVESEKGIEDTFTVTFDSQGGSAVPAVVVPDGAIAPKPADPVKTGALFAGWYNGSEEYDFNQPVTSDLYLSAKWSQNSYTVQFDVQGGIPAPPAAVVNAGATVAFPEIPAKAGSVFEYWALNGAPYDFSAPVEADITLTAVWSTSGHVITFDSQGGSPALFTATAGNGEKVARPADPVREGYTFAGWYNGAIAYNFNSAVTADLYLTARWTPSICVVTFTVTGYVTPSIKLVSYGARVPKPINPVRIGYTFNYWALDGEPYDFNAPVTSSITLTAVWR